jgi:geranylgeranyl diphosphate synthase type II
MFGESVAILAGDALLTKAFEIMLNKEINEDTEEKIMLEAAYKLAIAAGEKGMVGGQFADIKAEGGNFDEDTVNYIHNHKTAALIAYSTELGAILGYADEKDKANMKLFGLKIGRAFQIYDDVMDLTSTTEEMGKDAGSDLEKNKATYPAVYGIEKSKSIAEDLIEEAISLLDEYGKSAFPLKEIAYFTTNRKK